MLTVCKETDSQHTQTIKKLHKKNDKTPLMTYFNFVLTKACIVLEEIQKFPAFIYVITTVAAVTPWGNTETTWVYVVWCHHCTY